MKRFTGILILILIFALLLQSTALADTGKIGKEYTLDGECTFKVKSAKAYDVFFNQESGSSKQWIVVTVDILNWRTEQLFVKTEAKAQIIYGDDFDYNSDYVWFDPVGTYVDGDGYTTRIPYFNNGEFSAYETDKSGKANNPSSNSNSYENVWIKWNYAYYYNPITDQFIRDNNHFYNSTDPSKTILDPLVKRTYHYVFLVPDLVAEEEGACELIFTVCGEEYSFRF